MASKSAVPKKKTYIMSEDEAQRMQCRISHNDVLNQAQIAKRNFGNKQHKLKQRMYLHSVGKMINLLLLKMISDKH